MSTLPISLPPQLNNTPSAWKLRASHVVNIPSLISSSSPNPRVHHHRTFRTYNDDAVIMAAYRFTTRGGFIEEEDDDDDEEGENHATLDHGSFEEAVVLFNGGEYYKCHHVLEALWNESQEPLRTLVHGILQCAVGFHHLFNQNHRGAMMELGEGLCKLRRLNFETGPFHDFEQQVSAVLDFIYQTQLELAACTDEVCVTMDGSERSYQLLGGYAAGQQLYYMETDEGDDKNNTYLVFCPKAPSRSVTQESRIEFPVLKASEEHLTGLLGV